MYVTEMAEWLDIMYSLKLGLVTLKSCDTTKQSVCGRQDR